MTDIYKIPVLITEDYLKEYSIIPLNFDISDIRPFIPIAESVHIIPILGKALYNELIEQVAENDVTPENSTLLLEVYRVEAQCVVLEALPFIHSHITEKGITQGKSDNSDSISDATLGNITNHLESQIGVLKALLKDFLDAHSECYPLYVKDECCGKRNDAVRLYPNRNRKKDFNM